MTDDNISRAAVEGVLSALLEDYREHGNDEGYAALEEALIDISAIRSPPQHCGAAEGKLRDALRETAHCLDDFWDLAGISCGWNVKAVLDNADAALALPPSPGEGEGLLGVLKDNSWDLRCFAVPTGGDDADIGWRVIGHWQAEPHERTIAEVYNDDPAAAIRAALSPQSPTGETE